MSNERLFHFAYYKYLYMFKFRGAIYPKNILPLLKIRDHSWIRKQKMNFYFSYETDMYQLHVVDRFASFPLFYCIENKIPYVSEKIDDLIPHLPETKFDPIGYYGTGGMFKGNRNERTPFEGIKRIMPGHYLEFKNGKIELIKYWSFLDLKGKVFMGTYGEACEELGYLIRQGVKRCYEFDNHSALHLTGGFDSGTISAIIGQLSKADRPTFSILDNDLQNDDDGFYESSFIKKYQKYYPHLKPKKVEAQSISKSLVFPDADNWHGIGTASLHCEIAKETQNSGIKTILTGLGGDELASYGHSFQNVSYTVYYDWQVKLYIWWYYKQGKMLSQLIRTLIPKNFSFDAFKATVISPAFKKNNYWYTPSFNRSVKKYLKDFPYSLYIIPSSYNHRLKSLNRVYFTQRADNWNLLGRYYGVDYLHPLLDADLVSFCASLPRAFFKNRQHREMIKTALKDQLPSELLIGSKRPAFKKPISIHYTTLSQDIKRTLEELNPIRYTFANEVYNFQKMNSLLINNLNLLRTLPENKLLTRGSIYRLNLIVKEFLIPKATYLNQFFS